MVKKSGKGGIPKEELELLKAFSGLERLALEHTLRMDAMMMESLERLHDTAALEKARAMHREFVAKMAAAAKKRN